MTNIGTLDRFDLAILRVLATDARATQADIASRVHLSSTAVARLQRALEERGVVTGYHAAIDLAALGLGLTATVMMTLAHQRDKAFAAFERQVVACPSIVSCVLLTGSEDYMITLRARDLADFERIHREELSTLPGVAQMRSLFTLREIVRRELPPALIPTER